MSTNIRFQYYVEGESEKKLIEEFKKTRNMIISGNVNVVNVKQKELSNYLLANLSSNTVVILVFDTDTEDVRILKRNIETLKKCHNVREIWCVTQVRNLEEELIRATDVREIKDLIGCKSNSDFKRDWIREKRLVEKLSHHTFNLDLFWASDPGPAYAGIENKGYKVKVPKAAK